MNKFKRFMTIGLISGLMLAIILAVTHSVRAREEAMAVETAVGSTAVHYGTSPRFDGQPLTGPAEGEPLAIALNYLRQHHARLGLTAADVADVVVTDQYTSRHNRVTHIYLQQRYQGLGVHNALLNVNVAADGRIIHLGNRFVADLASAIVSGPSPTLSAEQAIQAAADHYGLTLSEPLYREQFSGGLAQTALFSPAGISLESIPVELVYQPTENGIHLAWDLSIYELDALNWWSVRLDARNGQYLTHENWVVNDYWGPPEDGAQHGSAQELPQANNPVQISASQAPSSYVAYPIPVESPNFASPAPPSDARVSDAEPWLDAPNASPYGWQDLNGDPAAESTFTRGNNVDAYEDSDNSGSPSNGNGSRVNGGATLDFNTTLDLNMDPTQSVSASIVNLYYWNNLVHDVMYEYGFDEAGGNFQGMNYTGDGAGNDSVRAEAQDGGGNCNANFSTPGDGSQPRMQQYLCNLASPRRDSSLDNGVIAHEYGHGISNRLTGGPANTGCLGNEEQMGEGWSDWVGYMMTIETGDAGNDARPIGTWLFGQGPNGSGIRLFPYSTNFGDNPQTYDSIKTNGTSPHSLGEVWALMLWEVNWLLIDEYGFNPDIYADWSTGGNNLMFQLVTDGMKMQPCSPGMVDGRDAILAADLALTGGVNQCAIWEGFAKRGLGWSADQGSSQSRTDGSEAFDMPPFCFVDALPDTQSICVGTDALFEIKVGPSLGSPPVMLTVDGEPAGTNASFNPNPVNTVPSTSTLTIGNTAGASPGNYGLVVTGTNSLAEVATTAVVLNVFDAAPAVPTLSQPADGATQVSARPSFEWVAVFQAEQYLLEVDDNDDFSSPEYTALITDTTHSPSLPLLPLSTYYWRVTPQNVCSVGTTSAVRSFTVASPTLSCDSAIAAVDFQNGLPADWLVENNAGPDSIIWITTADPGCSSSNQTNGSGMAACADSFVSGPNSPGYDTAMVTAPFDLTGYSQATLEAAAYYNDLNNGSNDTFTVDVWDGSTWNNELTWDEDHRPDTISLDLADYLEMSGIQIRFRYAGDGFDGQALLDDVALDCQLPGGDIFMPVISNDSG